MSKLHLMAIPAAALFGLAGGCTPIDTTLGGALRTDIALQVIDPDPAQQNAVQPVAGEQIAKAAERYRKGAVKQPVAQTTRSASGTGSGSGGSSGGGSGSSVSTGPN
ncbi:MAG: hypothetical protein WC816_08350 [Sphingomonas sp.]|jgi:uncharacterized membrane protein YgcG